MEYNIDYINLKYILISCFLVKAEKNVLDISYSVEGRKVIIQVVMLEGCRLSRKRIDNVEQSLEGFDVLITELCITKEQFNENKGEWQPRYYKWLEHLLFSKGETL